MNTRSRIIRRLLRTASATAAFLVQACTPPSTAFDDSFLRVQRADASVATPIDAGSDAGQEPPITLRDLTITALIYDRRTLLDGGRRVLGVRQGGATWQQRDGGWAVSGPIEDLDDGGYLVRNVPEGDVLVFFPDSPTLLTSAQHVDFSRFFQGRADAQPAARGVPTRLEFMTGIEPFVPDDFFILFSQETPFSEAITLRYQPMATGGPFTLDWSSFPFGMPNGSAGDRIGLIRFRQATNGALSWRSAVAGSTVLAPDLVSGGMSSTSITLRTTPIAGLTLDLDAPALEANARQIRPTLADFRASLDILATTGAETFGFSDLGWLRNNAWVTVYRMDVVPPGLARTSLSPAWVDLFPRNELSLRHTAAFRLNLSHPMGSGLLELYNVRRMRVPPVRAELTSTLSPVRSLAINGMPATSHRSNVGVSPVLTWEAPTRGTPTHYDVTLVVLSNGVFGRFETWRTRGTRLVIPSVVLRRGGVYALIVDAVAGSSDFDRPNLQPVDLESVSTCTEPFTP